MNIFRSIFNRGSRTASTRDAPPAAADVDDAIVRASRGELPIPELLNLLYPTLVIVPLAAEPRVSSTGVLQAWEPATVSKAKSSTDYVTVFTSKKAAQAFTSQAAAYAYLFQTTTEYVLRSLPQNHGVVFNVGSAAGFEWSPSGIAAYLEAANSSSAR